MAGKKEIQGWAARRGALVDRLLTQLEGQVQAAQSGLFKTVIEDFVDGLEKDGEGNIKNTLSNKRRLTMFDGIFNKYAKGKGLEPVVAIADGVGKILDFNRNYFGVFEKPATLHPIADNVKQTVSAWLGVTERGGVERNGYLDTLIKDPSVKNGIKNIALRAVVSQGGYNETKKILQTHIMGDPTKTGALQRYYRNFTYDLYSVADRTAGRVYADKLKFNYAIYEGGLVKDSREFCKVHNGKVFSREEIAKFDITEARPPGYDPFTDLGGYGCRHHLNWVPDAVAFAMRPELRDNPPPARPQDIAPIDPPPPPPKPKPTPPPPPARFGSFKTPKEGAEPVANLFKTNFSAKGLNIKSVEISPEMAPERFNRYADKIKDLIEEYNVFEGYSETSAVKLKFVSTDKGYGNVNRWNDGGHRLETINFGHKSDPGDSRKYVKGAEQLRFKSRVDEENKEVATVVHEFGHVIGVDMIGKKLGYKYPAMKNFWEELFKIRGRYRREMKAIIENNYYDKTPEQRKADNAKLNEFHLGDYANTNLDEFMAEGFTEYKLSSNPSKYAKEIGKLIDKTFKRKK